MGKGAHSSPLGRVPGLESFAKAQRSPAPSNLDAQERAGRPKQGLPLGAETTSLQHHRHYHYTPFVGSIPRFSLTPPNTSSHSARFHPLICSVIHSTNMIPRSTGEGTETLRLESSTINKHQGRGEGHGQVGFPEAVSACSACGSQFQAGVGTLGGRPGGWTGQGGHRMLGEKWASHPRQGSLASVSQRESWVPLCLGRPGCRTDGGALRPAPHLTRSPCNGV